MTTETLEKNPDRFAKAREAKAAKRAVAQAQAVEQDEKIARLEAQIEELSAKLGQALSAPKLPTHEGPDRALAAFLQKMRPGEQRDGIHKVVNILNPRDPEDGFQQGDFVQIKPGTQKEKAWRQFLEAEGTIQEGDPIYGLVRQYLGRTWKAGPNGKPVRNGKDKGPRKYKVQWPEGIGKDGVTEDELILVKAAD